MPEYRLKSGRHNDAVPGDTVELTERQYRLFSTKFEPVNAGRQGTGNSSDNFDAQSFVEQNVGPIEGEIESGEVDAYLNAILDAEKASSDRKGVKDAVQDRRTDLEG